jgi:hypothetical protein
MRANVELDPCERVQKRSVQVQNAFERPNATALRPRCADELKIKFISKRMDKMKQPCTFESTNCMMTKQ